ncbi:MAG: hypothetical protein JW850_06845 [Thermoflexales bacterium]|nr:hypothetical protein [Thermoflexales bacterium]
MAILGFTSSVLAAPTQSFATLQATPVATATADPFSTGMPGEAQTPQVAVVGQVVGGTAGQQLPPGLVMTLYALTPDMQTVILTRTAVTDEAGRAHFGSVPAVSGTLYAAAVDYGAVSYFSRLQQGNPDQAALTLPVTVYESTSDPALIRLDRLHLILAVQAGSLQVSEVWAVSNASDRVYLDGDGASLRVQLPAGATNLEFQGGEWGERYLPVEGGFVDTEAVRPGEQAHQLVFSFVLPYDGRSLDVALPLAYPLNRVDLLLPDVGVQLTSPQLVAAGPRQTQMGAYQHFTLAQPLAAGQALSFRLDGAVAGASSGNGATGSPPSWLLPGAVALASAALAGAFIWWRLCRPAAAAETAEADQDALIEAIAALDDAYEAAQLPESDYRRQRERLKAELTELMRC